jgi:hypothetical protein
MIGDSPLRTKSIGTNKDNGVVVNAAEQKAVESAGTEVFTQGAMLRIEIEGTEPILLKPKQETVFGRRDPATGLMPDVDLTPFAGYRMGVSRRHSAIRQNLENKLDLWDLGSSNGTYLNGTKLDANKPYTMRDGDEIRMGQMVMRVYYQQQIKVNPDAPQTTTNMLNTNSEQQPPSAPRSTDSSAPSGTSILGSTPKS